MFQGTWRRIRDRFDSTMTATRATLAQTRSSSLTTNNLEMAHVSDSPDVGLVGGGVVVRAQSAPALNRQNQPGSARSKSSLSSVTFSADVDRLQPASLQKHSKVRSTQSASASVPLSADAVEADKISTFKAHIEEDPSQASELTLGTITRKLLWHKKRSYDLNR